MSDKDKKFENEEETDDVEAHKKGHLGNTAIVEPKEDDDGGDNDVEAHLKSSRLGG